MLIRIRLDNSDDGQSADLELQKLNPVPPLLVQGLPGREVPENAHLPRLQRSHPQRRACKKVSLRDVRLVGLFED
jgi:hypothetical protein